VHETDCGEFAGQISFSLLCSLESRVCHVVISHNAADKVVCVLGTRREVYHTFCVSQIEMGNWIL